MPRIFPRVCVALLLTFTSAYAARRTLNSIREVYNTVPQPTNILELLRWFANTINIEPYGNMWVSFDPNSDYGSHHYGNFEGLLDQPPRWSKYYTVGNIHKDSGNLPSYVVDSCNGTIGWNRARIIFSAMENNRRWSIQRIYITQHAGTSVYNGTNYDTQHTYEIPLNLLREFRGRSNWEILQAATCHQGSTFGNTSTRQGQGFSYSNQRRYVHQSDYESYPRRTDEDNTLNVCLALICVLVFVFFIFLTNAK